MEKEKELTIVKEVEPAYRRHDFTKMPKSVARPAGDKTFVKFGQEIDIQDFINAGAENTSIMKHISDAGSLENLKAAGILDVDDTVIDRGMDFITLNRLNKLIKITEDKLLKQKQEEEKLAAEKAKVSESQENKGE